MEQTRIRQPKVAAAQSFLQILGTFLAIIFKFITAHLFLKKMPLYSENS